MILLTILGLRAIPPEVIEAGRMSGCTNWQLMLKVLIVIQMKVTFGGNQILSLLMKMN